MNEAATMKTERFSFLFFGLILWLHLSCGGPDRIHFPDDSDEGPDRDGEVGEDDNEDVDGNEMEDGDIVVTPLDGPAGHLLIDGSVHTGTDWNGASYIGVWGEPFDFRMDDYPLTWAIALVHASMLLRDHGIDFSPNAILSVAIKESRLGCAGSSFPNDDGCFQIESTTAYTELTKIFPQRFTAPHAQVIADGHFESSAIATVHYILFSVAMLHLHSTDPESFFAAHPDPYAELKVLAAAYNRGLWWPGLANVFSKCRTKEVTECFTENGTPHRIAIDHATAIAHYTEGLDESEVFDASITLDDLYDYWDQIRVLYPEVEEHAVEAVLGSSFEKLAKVDGSVSFRDQLKPILNDLIAFLPPLPSDRQVIDAVCAAGYLWQSPPCL